MKAAVVPGAGESWELREVPTPRPGPGEVLIRVRASGVCGNDVWLTDGTYPFPPLDPVIVGHEPAGEVVEVGPGVTDRAVGDRVGATWVQGGCGTCAYCRRHPPVTGQTAMNCPHAALTGMTRQGGHAEFLVAPAAGTVLLPAELSFEMAAPLLCAGYTAWSALRAAEPRPADRVAVLGVGGLGHLAVQLSRASGFETVAISRTADKHDLIRKLGADVVVSDSDELRDLGGADVIVVTGTSYAAASRALPALRADGRMVLANIDPAGTFTIDAGNQFFAQNQRILGATHNGLGDLVEVLDLAAQGKVAPMVEVFESDRIGTAVRRVADGDVRFRAVVTY